MNRFVIAAALFATVSSAGAGDVRVSVNVGQPGFHGRIDIGNAPPPQLVYVEPIIVQRTQAVREPIYLHVPMAHANHWRSHCGRYQACGRPVYFVQERWYNDVYVPHHRAHHAGGKGPKPGKVKRHKDD